MGNYYVVIPAAGQGKRMEAGKNKQFLTIDKDPLLIHTLRVFEGDLLCEGIILVINHEEQDEMEELVEKNNIRKVVKLVPGGKERQNSVYEGLKAVEGDPVVLVHDGARPFVKTAVIKKLVHCVEAGVSATVAVPIKDTVKKVKDGLVAETIDRSSLWAIQTPQAFRRSEILRAHKEADEYHYLGTDDASLMEYVNKPVEIVEGDYENIKITTPEDLLFAEAIIKKRKEDL
ncbi:2-C-methyl-D-erythritol 4-phosphate cytidylyltransferase [Bacillus shivajii]|uniref:2-C-methyl-D-erythritol 4-phosphate cytidylyltransferase n=1 Tax=Bacillus shivajii TaxID=1983719 RepID=UPI001CFA43D4|nr:2-C-methyl-D-erythritol 4-phosphate cytidylyltransferase [Bacillus shivajii]UCZ53348.1 2-C-methyl-D-erythritol 4-phosphate cytidylyltransferase [Bacillus shivajii]